MDEIRQNALNISRLELPGAPILLSPDEFRRSCTTEHSAIDSPEPNLHHHLQSRLKIGTLTPMEPIHLIRFSSSGRWAFKVCFFPTSSSSF